jgi:hypothetical protein
VLRHDVAALQHWDAVVHGWLSAVHAPATHEPFEQTCVAVHGWPQVPQLL